MGRGLLQRLIELGVVFGGSLVSLEDRLCLGYMYFGGGWNGWFVDLG